MGFSKIVESIATPNPSLFDETPNFVDDYAATICGTKLYMAPEVFQQRYNAKADVFSMGLVLYVMVTRCTIVAKRKEIYGLMINGMFVGQCLLQNEKYFEKLFQEEIWNDPQYSDLQDMIELMLTPDPSDRASSDQLKLDLEDDLLDDESSSCEELSSDDVDDVDDVDDKPKSLKVLMDLFKRFMN